MKHHASTCCHSRRSFLKGAGVALTGFGLTSVFPTPLIQKAYAGTTDPTKRVLFIFLRGGNDGINAVIPQGDPDYSSFNRPSLYISPTESINLNDFAHLHPALGDIKEMYDALDLAIIHRVGYPNASRSHFDSQRIWENGDPAQPQLFEGWLYRLIKEQMIDQAGTLPVLTAQPTPPLLTSGSEKFVNIANPGSFDYVVGEPKRTKIANGWKGIYQNLSGLEPYRPLLSSTGVQLVDTLDEYASWDQTNWNPLDPDSGDSLFPVSDETNPDDPSGPNGKKFASSSYAFFNSLKIATLSLLESTGTSTNGTQIAGTELGGWDHHDEQGKFAGQQPTLLSWLAYGLRSLNIVLSGSAIDDRSYADIWNDTVVFTMSEFGRTTRENGNFGTDHAQASCQFIAGGGINGGVYNCDPGSWPAGIMFGAEGRYLLERTDYRAIFWEILRDHLGTPTGSLETVFPGYTVGGVGAQELGLFT